MSDSSAENKPAQAPEESKKVPVEALIKERADKRAARSGAEGLKQELASRENPALDAEFIAQLTSSLAEEAKNQVEQATKPLRDEVSKYKMATALGLNEAQVAKVWDVRSKNPNLSESQALLLARSEQPDIFPAQPTLARSQGGFPVSGLSEARNAPNSNDFMSKMKEAEKAGDRAGAQKWAREEALSRFRQVFENRPLR